ncbi:hypothetical protein MMC25_005939 [Agyrium rufum]|nr:hypothetical protein [Agyrium rufum]
MDFARACTNLHHSTLAENSSPDSSPIIGGSRGMSIPLKRGFQSSGSLAASAPDSPSSNPNSLWTTLGNGSGVGNGGIAGSVGSVSMMDSDDEDSSSNEDEIMDQVEEDETIHGTPHATNARRYPFASRFMSSSAVGSDTVNPFSPNAGSLLSFQRARLRQKKNHRKSSGSLSGRSSLASPAPLSPPFHASIESSINNGNYFARDVDRQSISSRRQSLSLGTNDMNLTDTPFEEPESLVSPCDALGIPIAPPTPYDERRRVIRRAVTGKVKNLVPKSKNFSRIRAALQEESTPIDTEVQREAEVIRQVRDADILPEQPSHLRSYSATTASSPVLQATAASPPESVDEMSGSEMFLGGPISRRPSSTSFSNHAARNSLGSNFWTRFHDDRMRTPPPLPPNFARGNSISMMSENDMTMDTPVSSTFSNSRSNTLSNTSTNTQYSQQSTTTTTSTQLPLSLPYSQSRSRSSTPQPIFTAGELTRKLGKRRRDDDLDAYHFKRRAVSPGMSLQNSPIIPSSPAHEKSSSFNGSVNGGGPPGWMMQAKGQREVPSGHVAGERVGSGGSQNGSMGCLNGAMTPSGGGGKRVGLQGMTDTNDGLMNMSIE